MKRPYRKIPLEEWSGFEPSLFRELGQPIRHPLLEPDYLPPAILVCRGKEWEGKVIFQNQRFDLNIAVFQPQLEKRGYGTGSGVFVISNGAGVASTVVDRLAPEVQVAGMIDLKRHFVAGKILAALHMAHTARPDLDAVAVDIISGIALGGDAVEALDQFSEDTDGAVPIIFRIYGPRMHESRPLIDALAEKRPNVILAESTSDVVRKSFDLFRPTAPGALPPVEIENRVREALAVRARAGIAMDPAKWLTPELTLENFFGSKAETRVGVLGFGGTARFQTRAIQSEGVDIAWVATPSAHKHADAGIPGVAVYPTVREAVAEKGDVDIVLNYAPAMQVLKATVDCVRDSSQVKVMIVVAENMPYDQTIRVMDVLESAGVSLIGPNSPGVMIVDSREGKGDRYKLGNIPGFLFGEPAGLSVVGRSGTVIFDIVDRAARKGIGTRVAWAIGGDKYTGLGFPEVLGMLEQDPLTRHIAINGESGGIQEQLAAQMIATGLITKPVIAMITGKTLPAGIECGHQSAVKFTAADDPYVKERYLKEAGVICVDHPTDLVNVIQAIERVGWDLPRLRRAAYWDHIVREGAGTGLHWHERLRPAFELLYDLVKPYPFHHAHTHHPDHLRDLTTYVCDLGLDRVRGLLNDPIRIDAFVGGFERSVEYVAKLMRTIKEIGPDGFIELVDTLLTRPVFNQALATTPWAAADILNEVYEVGLAETQAVINKTMGLALFRRLYAEKPWNTAHAFRSINNMRWKNYVKAYQRYCTHLTGDRQLIRMSWTVNPWASVKLVRGYDGIPEGQLERALDDPVCKQVFVEKSRHDPQGLLDLGKAAFQASRSGALPFRVAYRQTLEDGVPGRASIEAEIAQMGFSDFELLINEVFTPEAFVKARRDHPTSTAQALRIINQEGGDGISGAQLLLDIFKANNDKLETPAFRLAVARNLWMTVDILRSVGRMEPGDVRRLVDYVLTQQTFDYSVAEHQWGTSQMLYKTVNMGLRSFFEAHRVLETAAHDRESFRMGFRQNPRDALEILQVVDGMGEKDFGLLMADADTRESFLVRMRLDPRHAAHFLQEVAVMGARPFTDFIDRYFGRPLLTAMLNFKGCHLVHAMRRVNSIGVEEFREELRAWKAEDPGHVLDPDGALQTCGHIRERVLDRRLSDSARRVRVSWSGQPTIEVSTGEIRGLYRSYPEWGDVLFKALKNTPLLPLEAIDLYHLVNGRKRFQGLIIPALRHFMNQSEIRDRINRGEALIPELRKLKGVAQRPPHRFDLYDHTMEVVDQLQSEVLGLEFLPEPAGTYVKEKLGKPIDGVPRTVFLILAAALHDIGKADGDDDHARRSQVAADPILDRLGLTGKQKDLVLAVIRYHSPGRIRQPDETWEAFKDRGGLRLLVDAFTDGGNNPYPLETILHYHADILGRQGDATAEIEVERRKVVTRYLVDCLMEAPVRA